MYNNLMIHNPLFKECVDILQASLLPDEQADQVTEKLELMHPITDWGKIDWEKINIKIFVGYNPDNIIPCLEKLLKRPLTIQDKHVYIDWSDGQLPAIKANLDNIVKYFDDVVCVAFEKFIFNPLLGYIIEVRTSGEITVGLVKPYDQLADVTDAKYIQHVKNFLQTLKELKESDISAQLPVIENEINTLINKIVSRDQAYEAQTYFKLLGSFKNMLKIYYYKKRISLSNVLQKFIKKFNRVDLQEIREKLFKELKNNSLF